MTIPEEELLRYALIGYQAQRAEIDTAMHGIGVELRQRRPSSRTESTAKDHQQKSRKAGPRRRQL